MKLGLTIRVPEGNEKGERTVVLSIYGTDDNAVRVAMAATYDGTIEPTVLEAGLRTLLQKVQS